MKLRRGSAVLLAAALFAPLRAAADDPGKADYVIYVLARDPLTPAAPDRADPSFAALGDVRARLEALGAKLDKQGRFDTPTLDGGTRGNEVVVYRASWTADERARAEELSGGADLVSVRIEPAAAPARARARAGAPPSAAEAAAARVRAQIGIALPPALLRGDGRAFDGSATRDAIADDYSRAAAKLGVPVSSLPRDPASLSRLLSAAPPPAAKRTPAPPPPLATTYSLGSITERVAAQKGLDPEILRGLLFASQAYSGGFARSSGLRGPMGLSLQTGRAYGLDAQTIEDPEKNIAAGADLFKSLMRMFGGDLSRSVAAFYCGSGAVRRNGGIPSECAGYLAQFYLSYQNGSAWAIDHNAPRRARPVEPQEAVSPAGAVGRALREGGTAAITGDAPPNKPWRSSKTPPELIARIATAVTQNLFDRGVKLDPDVFLGLVWAEGGYSPDNRRPNPWGAVGPTQVTYSGAEPHCKEINEKGRSYFDWRAISTWNNRKNVDCGAKVFYDRIQWTASKDPIIGLALYNTQAQHWDRIISRNRVPPFPETVDYVVRAAMIACVRSGRMILSPDHFENARAQKLARAEERRMIRSEFPADGNAFDPACRVFPDDGTPARR